MLCWLVSLGASCIRLRWFDGHVLGFFFRIWLGGGCGLLVDRISAHQDKLTKRENYYYYPFYVFNLDHFQYYSPTNWTLICLSLNSGIYLSVFSSFIIFFRNCWNLDLHTWPINRKKIIFLYPHFPLRTPLFFSSCSRDASLYNHFTENNETIIARRQF